MKQLIDTFLAPTTRAERDDKAADAAMKAHQTLHALRKCLRWRPLRAQQLPRMHREAFTPCTRRKSCSVVVAWMAALLSLTAATTLTTACTTTREVHHTEVRHDTLRLVHRDTLRTVVWMRDSVHQRDTSYREGTTLVREHWRDRWHWRHDTLRLVQRDSLSHASHRSVDHRTHAERHRPWWSNALPVLLMLLLVVLLLVSVLRMFFPRFAMSNYQNVGC